MKTKKKNIGDVGIRLKPIKHNLLENYTKIIKKRKKKTKKLKRKRKRKKIESTKSIEIHEKRDPFLDILNKPDKKEDEKKEKPEKEKPEKDKTDKPEKDKADKEKTDKEKTDKPEEPEFKKIKVQEGKRDISEKDPNIKSLSITVSTEPDKKKKGHSIKLE